MKKTTFIELYLVKHAKVTQEYAENLVKKFSELYPEKLKDGQNKCIVGLIGYVNFSHASKKDPVSTALYMRGDMETSIQNAQQGKQFIPSTRSYWLEVNENKMPKL